MPRGFWTMSYIVLIAIINWLFVVVPPIQILGTTVPPAMLIVGFVFVFRDFSQREIGHLVVVAMLGGGVISYFTAAPEVAVASVTAFLVSETVDWLVYSLTKKPLSQRILYSSAIGAPMDTFVFLSLVGFLGWGTVLLGSIAKMAGAVVFWWTLRQREVRTASLR